MTSTASPHRIDRIVDALIDRKHPFWQDERQAAVFNEASSAALVLQSILLPVVGGICLLIVGRPAIGTVTAMLLTLVIGQFLVMKVLLRRHVHFDTKAWRKDSSPFRKRVGLLAGLFYVACFLWARFHTLSPSKVDTETWAGLGSGIAFTVFAMAVATYAHKRSLKKHQPEDVNE
jgi:hypothetical protein